MKMEVLQLLVLGCILRINLAFYAEKGCEVNYKWDEDIRLPQYEISSWVSFDKPKIMELHVTFENHEEMIFYDKIMLFNDRYSFDKMRNFHKTNHQRNTSVVIGEGWNNLIFKLDGNYSMWHRNENGTRLLFEESLDMKPNHLTITGSNVTVNCFHSSRMWYVSKNPAIIPLSNSKFQGLSIYSNGDITPSIILGSKEVALRWNGNKISAVHEAPLPPLVIYNITIECDSDDITLCVIKEAENGYIIEQVRLSQNPESISILRGDAEPFFVLPLGNDPQPPLTKVTTTSPISDSSLPSLLVFLGCVIVVLCISLIGTLWITHKYYKQKKEVNKKINNRQTDEGKGLVEIPQQYEDSELESTNQSKRGISDNGVDEGFESQNVSPTHSYISRSSHDSDDYNLTTRPFDLVCPTTVSYSSNGPMSLFSNMNINGMCLRESAKKSWKEQLKNAKKSRRGVIPQSCPHLNKKKEAGEPALV